MKSDLRTAVLVCFIVGKEKGGHNVNRFFKLGMLVLLCLLLIGIVTDAAALRKVAEFDGRVSLNLASGMLLVQDKDSGIYDLLDSQLNPVRQIKEDRLAFLDSYPFIGVYRDDNNLQPCGLLNLSGEEVVPPVYEHVSVLSERWQLGFMESKGNIDVFFDGQKTGTLDISDIPDGSDCEAYGAYFLVHRPSNYVVGYDSALHPFTDDDMYYDEFFTKHVDGMTRYYHSGSGKQVFIPGCDLKSEDLVSPYHYQNGCLYDLNGNIFAQTSREYLEVEDFENGYATAYFDGKTGLIRLDGTDVAPPAYDVFNLSYRNEPIAGYFTFLKDGKRGFMDLSGNVTCEIPQEAEGVQFMTPFAYYYNHNGRVVVFSAAVGELPEHYSWVENFETVHEALVLSDAINQLGIVNLYGEVVFPFSNKYSELMVTDDGSMAVAYNEKEFRSEVFSLLTSESDPVEPDIPALSVEPKIPSQPADPVVPLLPDNPDIPALPTEPDVPSVPGNPPQQDDFSLRFCPSCGYKFTVPPLRFCPSCGLDLTPYLEGGAP